MAQTPNDGKGDHLVLLRNMQRRAAATYLQSCFHGGVCLAGTWWPKDEVGHGGMLRPEDGTHGALLLFV